MWQRILLPVGVFLAILIALSYGEAAAQFAVAWLSFLFEFVRQHFGSLYTVLGRYISTNTGKILLAALLTIPLSYWLLKSQKDVEGRMANRRKVAIVLALFLGWLGAHRFYLGQVAWGIVYLIIYLIFAPLAVVLGVIDAARYLFAVDNHFPAS